MKKYFCVFLLFPLIIRAQTADYHENVISNLNYYVEFINEATHSEYFIKKDLSGFNGSLLYKIDRPEYKIDFISKDYLNTQRNYTSYTVVEIYELCLNLDFQIENSEKEKLDLYLTNMMECLVKLQHICDTVELYASEKKYETDKAFTEGFNYLSTACNQFNSYLEQWKLLKNEINTVALKYEMIDMTDPYIRTGKNMDSLFEIIYDIAEAVRINDTSRIKQITPLLSTHYLKLVNKEDYYLKGVKSSGKNNGEDPFNRYSMALSNASDILFYANQFLKPTQSPNQTEKINGKPYYYYSNKIISKINIQGLGMAYNYNYIVNLSRDKILYKYELPYILKINYPQIPEPEKLTLKDAPPNNLIFLLDVSSSMNKPEKMPLLKESIKFLLTLMRDYDYVTIVTYSGEAKLVLPPTSASKRDSIGAVIDKLLSAGSTKLFPGLKLAYKSAKNSFIENGTNRIILATDGNFEIDDKMTKIVSKNVDKIQISALYFDKYEQYFEELTKLTEIGNGNCTQITPDNIKTALVKEARGE